MIEVISSNIFSIGYDNGILMVRFRNGRLYHYLDVPVSVYSNFMKASSKGKYLNYYVKGKYDYNPMG